METFVSRNCTVLKYCFYFAKNTVFKPKKKLKIIAADRIIATAQATAVRCKNKIKNNEHVPPTCLCLMSQGVIHKQEGASEEKGCRGGRRREWSSDCLI